MPWEVPLDADTVFGRERWRYDLDRDEAYRRTGAPRNDLLLPKLVPPGATLVLGDRPEDDLVLPPDAVPGAAVNRGTFGGRKAVFYAARWTETSWQSVRDASGRYSLQPVEVAVDGAVEYDPAWWHGLPWAREVVPFAMPAIMGQHTWEPSVLNVVRDEDPGMHYVAVPWPHPILPDLPPPIAVYREASFSGNLDGSRQMVAIYRTRYVLTGRGDRQKRRFYPLPDSSKLISGVVPADAKGVWRGHYEDVERGEWYDQAIEEVGELLAREGAVQLVMAGIAFTGVGAPAYTIMNLALAGAGQKGLTESLLNLAVDRLSPPVDNTSIIDQALTGEELVAAAAVVAPAAAPEETNRALADVTMASAYLDAAGPLGQLYGLSLRELSIRAQATAEERDKLRADVAARRAELEKKAWFRAVRQAATTLTAIGLSALGGGIALTLMSAAQATAQLSLAGDEVRARERAVRDRLDEQLAELDRQVGEAAARGLRRDRDDARPAAGTEGSGAEEDGAGPERSQSGDRARGMGWLAVLALAGGAVVAAKVRRRRPW